MGDIDFPNPFSFLGSIWFLRSELKQLSSGKRIISDNKCGSVPVKLIQFSSSKSDAFNFSRLSVCGHVITWALSSTRLPHHGHEESNQYSWRASVLARPMNPQESLDIHFDVVGVDICMAPSTASQFMLSKIGRVHPYLRQ